MDNIFCLQVKTGRNYSVSGFTMPDLITGILQPPVTGFLKDGTAYTTACLKSLIGRIDDRVCIQPGDSDFSDLYLFHGSSSIPCFPMQRITSCRSAEVASKATFLSNEDVYHMDYI